MALNVFSEGDSSPSRRVNGRSNGGVWLPGLVIVVERRIEKYPHFYNCYFYIVIIMLY